MTFVGKIVVGIVANSTGLWVAAMTIPGVSLGGQVTEILAVGTGLLLLNTLVRPVLKLIFLPLTLITLGLMVVVINMIILRLLDILFLTVSIQGVIALLGTAIITGILNTLIHRSFNP